MYHEFYFYNSTEQDFYNFYRTAPAVFSWSTGSNFFSFLALTEHITNLTEHWLKEPV